MKMFLDIEIKPPPEKISYHDKILVIGSCFTEHIGGRLQDLKFNVLQNPNGILFNPISVSSAITSYIKNKQYDDTDLFKLNELWQSWQHHSKFSALQKEDVLQNINESQHSAHRFLKHANWAIITLGSAFSYRLAENNQPVANCHRAPGQTFKKHLTGINEITSALKQAIDDLTGFNPAIKIVFTVSPVRHIRDGVIENNRSKARLLEAVHSLIDANEQLYYFPAYELVIDVLRDYRFYDIDLVHPNYAGTEFVFEKFTQSFIEKESQAIMEEVQKFVTAAKHKPMHPSSQAHQDFIKKTYNILAEFQQKHPHIDLAKEISYFSPQQ